MCRVLMSVYVWCLDECLCVVSMYLRHHLRDDIFIADQVIEVLHHRLLLGIVLENIALQDVDLPLEQQGLYDLKIKKGWRFRP